MAKNKSIKKKSILQTLKEIQAHYKAYLDDENCTNLEPIIDSHVNHSFNAFAEFLFKDIYEKHDCDISQGVIRDSYASYLSMVSIRDEYQTLLEFLLKVFVPSIIVNSSNQIDIVQNLHLLTRYVLNSEKDYKLGYSRNMEKIDPFYLPSLKVVALIYRYFSFDYEKEKEDRPEGFDEDHKLRKDLLYRILAVVQLNLIDILENELKDPLNLNQELYIANLESDLITFDFLRIFERQEILLTKNYYFQYSIFNKIIQLHLDEELVALQLKMKNNNLQLVTFDTKYTPRIEKLTYLLTLALRIYYPKVQINNKFIKLPDEINQTYIKDKIKEYNSFFYSVSDSPFKKIASDLFLYMLSTGKENESDLMKFEPEPDEIYQLYKLYANESLNPTPEVLMQSFKSTLSSGTNTFFNLNFIFNYPEEVSKYLNGDFIEVKNFISYFKFYTYNLSLLNNDEDNSQALRVFYLFLLFKFSEIKIYFAESKRIYYSKEFLKILDEYLAYVKKYASLSNKSERVRKAGICALGLYNEFETSEIRKNNLINHISFDNFLYPPTRFSPEVIVSSDKEIELIYPNLTFICIPQIQYYAQTTCLKIDPRFATKKDEDKFNKLKDSNNIKTVQLLKEDNKWYLAIIFNKLDSPNQYFELKSFRIYPSLNNPLIESDLGFFQLMLDKASTNAVVDTLSIYYDN